MIRDSGERRQFDSGAVRDIQEGKGRCDLLPLDTLGFILRDTTFDRINQYVRTGDTGCLKSAILHFTEYVFKDIWTGILDVSRHYEDGANKYTERNWEKGIPVHCFIDSGVRHLIKFHRGDKDESHDRAFIWNMLGAIWTHENKPEMIDLPFKDKG